MVGARSQFRNYTVAQATEILKRLGEPRDPITLAVKWSNGRLDPHPQAIKVCEAFARDGLSWRPVTARQAQEEVDRVRTSAAALVLALSNLSGPAREVLGRRGCLLPPPIGIDVKLLQRLREAAAIGSIAKTCGDGDRNIRGIGRPRTAQAEEFTRHLFEWVWIPWRGTTVRGEAFTRFIASAIHPTGILPRGSDERKMIERAWSKAHPLWRGRWKRTPNSRSRKGDSIPPKLAPPS
jgi:hypothetical protein